ncbi:integrase-recombinase protein [Desulfocucumis palustris]|uniref:Integrase-recombinase protein n=1 Tax=Desulfocucumis palustris TaxID=1898651 RepID=A0A2L2XN89_9FIRM|nr:tyrosine-type recombinase/integrase [Desulfocucumis palustris]GBF35421.1 integrase-recombinase protein [Desulfocucumis palustris]
MPQVNYLKKFGIKNLDCLLDGFKAHLQFTDRSASSDTYLGIVKAFAGWMNTKYGDFNPASVSPLDVTEYRGYLQNQKGRKGKPMSPLTINKKIVSLRVFFTWLEKSGQVRDNPVSGVKQIALANKSVPKWLNRNEQAALIHAVQDGGNLRDMAIVGIMLHAGLRVSEVFVLDRADIEISHRKGVVRVRRGKGNKYREVPLNKTIRKILVDWMNMNPNQEVPLFPNRYGRAIGVQGIEKLFSYYVNRARPKLDNVTPHSLRHTFCKNLIDSGVSLDQVAMLAGHSSMDVTKRYTAPSMNDLQAAVEKTAWE